MSRMLRIAAAVMLDRRGRMLMVRKDGTVMFMQPGGKLEPGESAAACLARELEEELGLRVSPTRLEPVGRYTAPAANETGWTVDCEVFKVPTADVPDAGDATARAEIAEARWCSQSDLDALAAQGRLAPLTRDNLAAFLTA